MTNKAATEAHEPETSAAQAAEPYQHSSCPTCGSRRGEPVFREKCEGTDIAIVVCADCGLGYSNPRPTEAYKLARYQEWAHQSRPWQAEAHYDHRQQLRHFHLYRRVMQLIHRRVPRGKILDVGCGGGLFLIFAGVFASEHNAGINSAYQPEGAGFDPQEIALARRVSGANVWSLEELRGLPDRSYDAVTLLNVLEHVNHPKELLVELRRLLRPGGVLVTVVPNNSVAFWKLRRGMSRQASFVANEHINHFRGKPLASLLRRAGFRRVEFKPALAAGTYGSMPRVPARQLVKHTGYRVLDLLSFGRLYLYSEIICVAE